MTTVQRIAWGALLCWSGATALGQHPVPLADRVEEPLLPSGISEHAVAMSGQLAYMFQDTDGTDAVHIIGEVLLRLGGADGQELRAREAVIWLTHRAYDGRAYLHLQVFLWQDAEVNEIGGTITSGPALFVTLNTFGEIRTDVDDLAFQSSSGTRVYEEGNAIRNALTEGGLPRTQDDVSLRVFDASGMGSVERKAEPKPAIVFRSDGQLEGPKPYGDSRVITVIGGVFLARGAPESGQYLEISADSAVVFLPSASGPPGEPSPGPAGLGTEGGNLTSTGQTTGARGTADVDRPVLSTGFGDFNIEAVYLEGDVIMAQGPNMIRASRLYYDFQKERAIILDAVVRAMLVKRNIPLYMRAREVQQLSTNQFTAENALLTTSEFYTPHYHVGAKRVDLVNRTPPEPSGRQTGVRAGSFRIQDATLNLGGTPVFYWPYIRGSVDTSETAIKSLRTGFSDEFGVEIETAWQLFNVLGLQTPTGFDATLSLDYFSERGPAIGVDAEYKRDKYFGTFRSYLLTDNDIDFLGRDRERLSPHDVRGRFLTRHRQYLEDDWQLSFELSFISDRGFLEEFFESEFDNEKEQETLLYLKKQRANWAFTALLQARILDFTTQTERLPDLAFFLAGERLGGRGTWFSENRLGMVRYRPADQTFRELLRDGRMDGSGSVARVDSRQEIGAPLDLGPLRLVPFATARGTAWDDSLEKGGLGRAFGAVGIRGSMYFSRTRPDYRSTVFDLHGIRHVVKPDFVAWASAANVDADDLFPFDPTVEGIQDTTGVMVGLRQRWQTKRGQGATRRTVDFLTLDVEMGAFTNADGNDITNGYASYSRPEDSITRNFVNSSLIWRINDRTALVNEMNYDLNDGEVDVFNLSLAVERPPRLSYIFGYRFIEESNSNLLGFDMNYRLTEKHTMAVRERFDLDRGGTLDFTVAFIRKFPRWFGAVSFALDEAEDDFGVSFSLWPEGLPRAALGSRRFTGLATTTRIVND